MDLKGFQGYVKKNATIYSDDPQNPRAILYVQGKVQALIEVRPEKVISFQGMADHLGEKSIDISSTLQPFHIRKVEDDLKDSAAYRLETVEDGRHYRLRVSNRLRKGIYRGSITLHTDLPQKAEVTVWVHGTIEGEIGAKPNSLVLGRLSAEQPVLSGKVLVTNNRGRNFRITKCAYDEHVIHVTQAPFPNEPGFCLEVIPNMENIPAGGRLQTTLTIETDVAPGEKLAVQIQALNVSE